MQASRAVEVAAQRVSQVHRERVPHRAWYASVVSVLLVFMVTGASTDAAGSGNAWTPTGAMTVARAGHAATLLPTGKVLVAGGRDCTTVPDTCTDLSSAELYDPNTGQWTSTGSMATARYLPMATVLQNGEVLVAGGCSGTPCISLSSAEVYSPTAGTWTSAGSMSTPRWEGAAVMLPSGKVLVAGGATCTASTCATVSSAEIYDPATGVWIPTGSMAAGRVNFPLLVLHNGTVLAVGGDAQGNTAELYDPSTGVWTSTGSMAAVRTDEPATVLGDGKVLVAGGADCSANNGTCTTVSSAELYDPGTGAWTTTGSMPLPRLGDTATLLPTGQVLVAGGEACNIQGACVFYAGALLYNPLSGTWIATARMSVARFIFTATLLPVGGALVVGGTPDEENALASAEIYAPRPLAVNRTSGTVGQSLSVSGTAFTPGEPISLYWDTPSTTTVPLTTTVAASDGSFVAAIRIPPATGGQHVLVAVGRVSGTAAFAYVQVAPSMRLVPAAGVAGSGTVAQGFGFAAHESVTAYWGSPFQVLGSTQTDGSGSFTLADGTGLAFTVPTGAAAGLHLVYAQGHTSGHIGVGLFVVH